MKIKWVLGKVGEELSVTVVGYEDDPEFIQLKATLSTTLGYVVGKHQSRQYRIPYQDIYYLESQDEHTTLFTNKDSFTIPLRLYEIEAWGDPFVRINKSTIINFNHLTSFKPMLNSKLEASLDNGDRLEVSRMYLPVIKAKLGVK